MVNIALPARLDASCIDNLMTSIKAARGKPLSLDARELNYIGGLGTQALLVTVKTWNADRQPIQIANASDEFRESMALLGVVGGLLPLEAENA